jgi:hypothetical protein
VTLQELLDELKQGILRDSSSILSGPADSLWSDEALVRYIDEAQMRLATIGLVLRDASTPAVTQVKLSAGKSGYTLHTSLLAIISARYEGDARDLIRTGHAALSAYTPPSGALTFDPEMADLPPGKPVAWASDEQLDIKSGLSGIMHLRVYPEPTAEYTGTVYLRTIRKPLAPLSLDNLEASPEVPEQYHLSLLDWAAYRALRNIDSDVGNISGAKNFREPFDELVRQARRDTLRKLFAPTSWGFGRSGFVWDSW